MKIDKGVIPTFSDVVGVKKGMFIDRVGATIAEGGLELFDPLVRAFQAFLVSVLVIKDVFASTGQSHPSP